MLRRLRVVDVHAHFLPASIPDLAGQFGGDRWPWLRREGKLPAGEYGYGHRCSGVMMVGDEDFRPVTRPLWDVAARK